MKIISVQSLALPEIKIVRYARFLDHRGYFTEHYRKSDFNIHAATSFLRHVDFVQSNESYSHRGTVRGLHFQWDPPLGKLVRTLYGHMIDLVLDIRKGSPRLGKIIAYDMPARPEDESNTWIWVPPGFAHGSLYLEESAIEYYCTGDWNPTCEAGVSPLAEDLDWTLCEPSLRAAFLNIAPTTPLLSPKDRAGLSLAAWQADSRSSHFTYKELP